MNNQLFYFIFFAIMVLHASMRNFSHTDDLSFIFVFMLASLVFTIISFSTFSYKIKVANVSGLLLIVCIYLCINIFPEYQLYTTASWNYIQMSYLASIGESTPADIFFGTDNFQTVYIMYSEVLAGKLLSVFNIESRYDFFIKYQILVFVLFLLQLVVIKKIINLFIYDYKYQLITLFIIMGVYFEGFSGLYIKHNIGFFLTSSFLYFHLKYTFDGKVKYLILEVISFVLAFMSIETHPMWIMGAILFITLINKSSLIRWLGSGMLFLSFVIIILNVYNLSSHTPDIIANYTYIPMMVYGGNIIKMGMGLLLVVVAIVFNIYLYVKANDDRLKYLLLMAISIVIVLSAQMLLGVIDNHFIQIYSLVHRGLNLHLLILTVAVIGILSKDSKDDKIIIYALIMVATLLPIIKMTSGIKNANFHSFFSNIKITKSSIIPIDTYTNIARVIEKNSQVALNTKIVGNTSFQFWSGSYPISMPKNLISNIPADLIKDRDILNDQLMETRNIPQKNKFLFSDNIYVIYHKALDKIVSSSRGEKIFEDNVVTVYKLKTSIKEKE